MGFLFDFSCAAVFILDFIVQNNAFFKDDGAPLGNNELGI